MTTLRPISELTESYTIVASDSASAPYFLTGKRGAVYMLMRNVNNPEALFVVTGKGNLPHNLRDQWFTDRGFSLEG